MIKPRAAAVDSPAGNRRRSSFPAALRDTGRPCDPATPGCVTANTARNGETGVCPPPERERELAASASELERTRARLAEAELRLQAAKEREEMIARTHSALAERARGELAVCPQCRKPLRGSDLFVSGHCPNCKRAITTLLTPSPQTGAPDRDAYLALLGALGGLVGLALASTTDGGYREPNLLGASRSLRPATSGICTRHPVALCGNCDAPIPTCETPSQ